MSKATTRDRTIELPRAGALPAGGFLSSLSAELFLLRKRAAYWILLALWIAVGTTFGYIVPYLTWRNNPNTAAADLNSLLPENFVGTMAGGFPFYGGAFALILGVLFIGSDYGWGTLKTLLTQRPGRLTLFCTKLVALAIALVPFVISMFAIGAIASGFIAGQESAPANWPSVVEITQGVLASWFIVAVWAALGVMLAVLSRGTSLAIGVGLLYAVAIEGLLSALVSQISLLEPLVDLTLRANAYSLVQTFGGATERDGPGAFRGPFVGTEQSILVLALYLIVFLGVSAFALRRRDVNG
jgi:ABC-type transport system involved in multi-copper enzyme maturation permease subunit